MACQWLGQKAMKNNSISLPKLRKLKLVISGGYGQMEAAGRLLTELMLVLIKKKDNVCAQGKLWKFAACCTIYVRREGDCTYMHVLAQPSPHTFPIDWKLDIIIVRRKVLQLFPSQLNMSVSLNDLLNTVFVTLQLYQSQGM